MYVPHSLVVHFDIYTIYCKRRNGIRIFSSYAAYLKQIYENIINKYLPRHNMWFRVSNFVEKDNVSAKIQPLKILCRFS